jgi:CxxC-x17-CxxC domain-containing protein
VYTDEQLTCTDCGATFVFTAGEQQFFATKGFQNKPNRCPDCRTARKNARQGGSSSGGYGNGGGARGGDGGFGGGAREMFSVTCSSCGQQAEVPFQPRGDKPVYCRDCFQSQRSYR